MWMYLWLAMIVDSTAPQSPDFDTQIIPILTKAGCNAGTCHGAAAGRGGLHLSLYGSRPAEDFTELTLALEGRRVNRLNSELSLLLQKPTEQLSHEGGTRLDIDQPDYQTVKRWIECGAKRIASRKLQEFVLSSTQLQYREFQLVAKAVFTDGARDDVLSWTVFTPHDASNLNVSNTGVVTVKRPGRHLLTARYLDQVRTVELIVPWSEPKPTQATQRLTSIDDFVDSRLSELGLMAIPAADDFTFIRRVALDLTGRLPTPITLQQFVNDAATDKREKLVERLLDSSEFVDFWGHRLALLFRVGQLKGKPAAANAYYDWLRECVKKDVPFDEVARQMLMAEGPVVSSAPANFYNVVGDARAQAEFTSQVFMGVRMQCANCHDHPLDAWTQDDYHGLAAVFARVKRGDVIVNSRSGESIHPATGEAAVAKIPAGSFLDPQVDHRAALAKWLTSADNSYFAQAIVNRVWGHMLGRGLVDPIDDLRVTNPATHPELLNWLARDFVEQGFRLRPLIQRIASSQVYARGVASSAQKKSQPEEFYAAAISRPLSPEVFLDAVLDATGDLNIQRAGFRSVSLAGITEGVKPLESLGRCGDACESPLIMRAELTVQLQLLNGPELNDALTNGEGFIAQSIQSRVLTEAFISDSYLRLFSRPPRSVELDFWKAQFPQVELSEACAPIAQDMLWSLLNSDEFSTNH